MNNLLEHSQFGQIRVEKHSENFIFCAKDVCDALGYADTEVALRKLDADEKLMRKFYASGQYREMNFVTESGLYALIIRSNKPAARMFRKWITSEVLPALRKYGVYSTNTKVMERAERKREDRAVKQLLGAIDSCLSATDRRLVAKQCLTTEWDVYDVLGGRAKDAHMPALLYARVTSNKLLNKCFYTTEGAEQLLAELTKTH